MIVILIARLLISIIPKKGIKEEKSAVKRNEVKDPAAFQLR